MESISDLKGSKIQNFYDGANIFITGGTGFIGKLIIEKLLRSCNVKNIYLLIRAKKGQDAEQRKNQLMENEVFDPLRKMKPDAFSKVNVVAGDVDIINYGLSETDYNMITNTVNIMFHLAANVSFNQTLHSAINTNVRGTVDILQMAKKCLHLKAFVYVSTAYANCIRKEVYEKFYDPPVKPDEALSIFMNCDEMTLELLSAKLLGEFPNSYTYSKCITENLIKEYGADLPIAIVRPTMIIGVHTEPIPGWTDNLYGSMAMCAGVYSGVIHVAHADKDMAFDMVPADKVSNCAIAAAWDTTLQEHRSEENIPIYQISSGVDNPTSLEKMNLYGKPATKVVPLGQAIWCPCLTFMKSITLYKILAILFHVLPGTFLDLILKARGQKPRLMKIYRKIEIARTKFFYFAFRSWIFHNDNAKRLLDKMDAKDKILFNTDVTLVNWAEYFPICLTEGRKCVFKEGPETLERARKKLRIFSAIHYGVKFTFYGCVLYTIYNISKLFVNYLGNLS